MYGSMASPFYVPHATTPGDFGNLDPEIAYRRWLAEHPPDVATLRMLAVLLGKRAQFDEATRLLERAVQLTPYDPGLYNDLGVTCEQAGDPSGAARWYRQSLRLQPDSDRVWSNLASALFRISDFDGAADAARKALALQPRNVLAHVTLGGALLNTGSFQDALSAYRRALQLCPDHPQAHCNYGLALLLHGDYQEGWKEHEWRRKLANPFFQRPGPAWDGSDARGQMVLLYGEGGLGNIIQFARYVPLVHERGARVIVECQNDLAAMIATISGVSQVVSRENPCPDPHAHCPLTSLPALFNTRLDTIPATVPYLHLPTSQIERWRPIVNQLRGLKVGVCWKGSQPFTIPRSRSIEPRHLLPLTRIAGVNLVSLQHGEQPPADLPLLTLPGLEPESMSFDDAAAVMMHMDLVIACDTSIAHLAGALGRPTWVALGYFADWRWMLDRDDTPWYPTMRLFRQKRLDDWEGVIARMANELSALSASKDASTTAAATMRQELRENHMGLQNFFL